LASGEVSLKRGIIMADIPPGFCQCGCGERTRLAKQNRPEWGHVLGQPLRFVNGHGTTTPRPPSRTLIIEGKECRTIPLTKGQEAIVDAEDYPRLSKYKYWARKNKLKWYAHRTTPRSEGKTNIQMASDVLATKDGLEIDHRNGNSLDNRCSNLRLATHKQNGANMSKPCTNTSGYKGVSWLKKDSVWQVGIKTRQKRIFLGRFPKDRLEDAARCYDKAARELFGEFANLNFPMEAR
jgi:hypothetical protein